MPFERRNWELFVEDMLRAINRIQERTVGHSFEEFTVRSALLLGGDEAAGGESRRRMLRCAPARLPPSSRRGRAVARSPVWLGHGARASHRARRSCSLCQ